MKKIFFLSIIILNFLINYSLAEVITGKIDHNDLKIKNKIIDYDTQTPVSNAKISIPEIGFSTYSDKNGNFTLSANIDKESILIVEKDGYKVFSLNVDKNILNSPLKLGIEKTNSFDLQISQDVIHLGDNMFSENSANSSEFRTNATNSYLSIMFKKPFLKQNQIAIVKIGTIIGLDTKKAKSLGQNRIAQVYSSPMEVYVNGNLIRNIEINQNNLEIKIPNSVLKVDNELVIQTGRNLFQTEYIDYDDCELANIRIEVKNKEIYARKH